MYKDKEMKYLLAIVLLIISSLAHAGPQVDRSQAVLDGLQGSTVTTQQGNVVLDAFVDSFPDLIPEVLTEVCAGEDEEGNPICNLTLLPKAVGDLTVDEKADIFNARVKSWVLRITNQYRERQKRLELLAEIYDIDAQVAAVVQADL